jgi:HEAT repeat protein
LGKGADSDNTALAKTAIVGLGQLDAEPATAVLRRLAQNAEHPHRVTIAAALHRNDVSGTAARFSAILQEDASVRRDAIGALTELADFDATPLLIMALEDTDAKVRQQASAALTDSTEPDAVNAMDTYFTRTIDEIVEQLASGNRVSTRL